MSMPRLVCCCGLILLSWRPALAAETALHWKFRTGDEHHYRMTQNMEMEMSLGAEGRQIETDVQQTLDMTWKIDQVDDSGLATMTQRVTRVRMDMRAPGQPELHYDTDSDEAPAGFAAMMVPLIKALTSAPLRVTITPRGAIQTLEVPAALATAVKSVPGAAMMGEMFSEEGFKKMIQQSSLILPERKDLEPGYEWTTKAAMKNAQFGQMDTETTYRFLGPREVKGKEVEVFGLAVKIRFVAEPGGAQLDVVHHDSHGEIFFSREAGRLESSKLQQDLDLDISAADQVMTQKLVQTVVFERVENGPRE